ncbi:MAG TPA: N-acyl homoserine lactonase family protein [Gammaproteobacteria bacterium]|nr:N-acyl homoserine lactonase family protein [Gammaproteobacteria bacterium]
MTTPVYEVYAIKYAEVGRKTYGNFIDGDPHDDSDMPLNYYVWAIIGEGRKLIVDMGFDAAMASKRGRRIVHPVEEGLEALGMAHRDIADVIITHMHYDHAGNRALFPNARFHLQDAEMEYVTGRCMGHHQINHAFEPDDVARMVHRVFAGQVCFHDGTDEIAPGITVHRLGGHTKGLQCVRVATRRGQVVLASDATHFYAHMEQRRAFPVLYNLGELLEGYKTLRRLASTEAHVIPGHDPLVFDRYPATAGWAENWIARLDVEPTRMNP